jgi:hypothetical protein
MSHTDIHGFPGTPYIPGKFYDATRGLTRSQFESPSGCAKAALVEKGFLREPSSTARAIIVCNLSGIDINVVCDREKRVNKSLPAVRENENEINGFLVPNGSSGHFNIPPWCYDITVGEFVVSENGGKKWLTRQGFQMAELANKTITYRDGQAQGTAEVTTTTGNQGNYAYINNYSSNPISVIVTKSTCAYSQSDEEIQQSKESRQPDTGGEKAEARHINIGGEWHFKQPPRKFTIRALETPSESEGNNYSLMGENSRVPDATDYVELCAADAVAGQVVVFLASGSRSGAIIAKTYNVGEIKLVDSDIALTSREGLD